MTGIQTLVARAALGIAGICGGVVGTRGRVISKGGWINFERAAMLALVGSRAAIFGLVFLVLHLQPRGDIPSYYFPQAEAVLKGLLPYVNFESSYAPLHPYLDALAIEVWRSPVAIILLAVLSEIGMFWVWLRFSRRLLSERTARVAAILYIACPISLQYVTIDGQDNVLIALLLALALVLLYQGHELGSGALFGFSIAAVKFLPLIFLPVYLVAATRKIRWALSCAVVLAVSYGTFVVMRVPLLAPLYFESGQRTAGNLPFVVESLVGRTLPGWASNGAVLACMAVILALVGSKWTAGLGVRVRAAALGTAALTIDVLLLAKKSWAGYMLLALFPICMVAASRTMTWRRIAAWSVAILAALLEHSFWSSIMGQPASVAVHGAAWSGDWRAVTLMLLDILTVAGYGWLLAETLRAIGQLGKRETRDAEGRLEQPAWADVEASPSLAPTPAVVKSDPAL